MFGSQRASTTGAGSSRLFGPASPVTPRGVMRGDFGQPRRRPSLSEAFATTPRLKVAAFLAGCAEADFATIAEISELTPATLSKAATALENAGYVRIRKGHIGRRPRTWLSLTKPAGQRSRDTWPRFPT